MKLLLITITILFSTVGRAQEIAPLVSFEFGAPLFFNRDAGVLNQFGSDSSGTSVCYSYGIGADVRWPKLSGDLGVASNLQFVYSTGKFTFDNVGASVTGVDRKLRLELNALESFGKFDVRAGGWLSSRVSASVWEHDSAGNLITPSSAASQTFHVGPTIGAEYTLGELRASLFGNYDLTSSVASHGFSVGLSLAYAFSGERDIPKVQPQTIPANLAKLEFTVNDTPHYQNISLQKVERHVHEYAMQKDSIVTREWIEESYHLPHIRLRVSTPGAVYVPVTANGALLNRYRVKRDSSLTINDLSALDIHKTNEIIATVENGACTDTLILPEISDDPLAVAISQREYRFRLAADDSTHFKLLLDTMKTIGPTMKNITIRTPHGETWAALTQRIRVAIGNKAKYHQAYNAKEITIIMTE